MKQIISLICLLMYLQNEKIEAKNNYEVCIKSDDDCNGPFSFTCGAKFCSNDLKTCQYFLIKIVLGFFLLLFCYIFELTNMQYIHVEIINSY